MRRGLILTPSKAETEMLSLRAERTQPVNHSVQPYRSSFANTRAAGRQADGTYAFILQEKEKEYQEERAKKRAAAEQRWKMGERRSKEERDRAREGRYRRREERKLGEEKRNTRERQERDVAKVVAGMETGEKYEQELNDEKKEG